MNFVCALSFAISLAVSQIVTGPLKIPYVLDSAFFPRSDVERLPHVDVADHPWRTRMQSPLSPESSLAQIRVPQGFRVDLFAAEPLMGKAVAMAWDERGRLWLLESEDYPILAIPPNSGRDRIRILEDTDRDGRADHSILYAEGLSVPTGLTLVPGGVVVAAAPHLFLFRDRDGDGRADDRQILYTGFSTYDTHGGPNHLTYAPDGWLYGVCGVGGTVMGMAVHPGLWRARLDGTEMQWLSNGAANNWGLGFSQEGDLFFGATEDRALQLYTGRLNNPAVLAYNFVHRVITSEINQRNLPCNFNPGCSNEEAVRNGGYWLWNGASMGLAVYAAADFPDAYRHKSLFLCDPTLHTVTTGFVEWNGGQPEIVRASALMSSYDAWTAPIGAEVGPDGAVWLLDWYNYMVSHIAVPPDSPLRDHARGRVYRISHGGTPVNPTSPPFDARDPSSLAGLFSHSNLFWRMAAQRLLAEYGTGAGAALWPLLSQKNVDTDGHSPAVYHALWTLENLGAMGAANPAQRALVSGGLRRHPSPAVRRAAIEVVARHPGWPEFNFALTHSLCDPDPRNRRAALQAWVEYLTIDSTARSAVASVSIAAGAFADPVFSEWTLSLTRLIPSLSIHETPAWTPDSAIHPGKTGNAWRPRPIRKRLRIPKEALLGRFPSRIQRR